MAFSLAEDRGLSRSRFNRHSPGFNQHSDLVSFALCFGLQMREWLSLTEACLAVVSICPLLVSIGTRLCRLLRASVRRCGNGFLFSQRPRPVSLWNEVPLTLIARRWPCAFFLSDSNRRFTRRADRRLPPGCFGNWGEPQRAPQLRVDLDFRHWRYIYI